MSELDQHLSDLVADGKMAEDDAAAIRRFQDFLSDPEVGRPSNPDAPKGARPLPTHVLQRHQEVLGISDDELAQIKRSRGEATDAAEA